MYYNYYILQDLDFKALGLQIWISIVIYLTGFGLESGIRLLDFTVFGLGNTWTVI